MKLTHTLLGITVALGLNAAAAPLIEMAAYAAADGSSGLRLAFRADSTQTWQPMEHDFVRCDFGQWGAGKKMYAPRIVYDQTAGQWTAWWNANPQGTVVALATSADLFNWAPQSYYASVHDLPRTITPASQPRVSKTLIGKDSVEAAIITGIDPGLPASLRTMIADSHRRYALTTERMADDTTRFANLRPLSLTITPRPQEAKPISDKLIGIFFEDINYSADGGLYGELMQNRDFEYTPSDRSGDKSWNSLRAWSTTGSVEILTANPVHPNNPHYARLGEKAMLVNEGYDSLSVVKGEKYHFSVMARSEQPASLTVTIMGTDGKALATKTIALKPGIDWGTYTAILRPSQTDTNATLRLALTKGTEADVDMVSLFPQRTFHNRPNGLRADLAQTFADLKPRFVRFPGGCVAHGDGIDNIYDWKGSIGPLHERKPLRNLWGYHQTRGLGYHEYFLFCEDIGAEPLPVLAAGVPCQNSSTPSHHSDCPLTSAGQQGGIPMDEMPAYIQDVLDLIEYANGPADSEWGARRAAAGHPEPFRLKYIGIGNEDLISDVFETRFRMIYDAVAERYPEITVVGTVGPFNSGSDYEAGWALAREMSLPMVDEHYYVSPGWLINNQDFYDSYPRGRTQVYLGEYASHVPGRHSSLEAALSDAIYLTAVERNSDVVAMTSYAPLLAKKGHTQWRPDMIYFDNESLTLTPDYWVQHMFGNNSGQTYIPSALSLDTSDGKATVRVGVSVVKDAATGQYILKVANLLPVEVNASVALEPLSLKPGQRKATVLTGSPAQTDLKPAETKLDPANMTLAPYSLTVIRL